MNARLAAWSSAAVTLVAACVAVATPAAARVDALDIVAVSVDRIDGLRPHELSGLAWDHGANVLYAVSDRGVLFAWRLDLDGERIARFAPLWARPLAPTGHRLNAEALDIRYAPYAPAGDARASLIVADELGATAWSLDPQTMAFAPFAWPGGLADRDRTRASNHGVEALAWSTRWGAIAALQRPRTSGTSNTSNTSTTTAAAHEIHAERAPHPWLLSRALEPKGAIKAVEAGPARHVTVLERVGGGTGEHRLRRFDPADCRPATPCAERIDELPLLPNLPTTPNWEGLACRPDGVCVVVSDDADHIGHGWLLLLRLPVR